MANTSLSRTNTSPSGSGYKYTFSAWIKRSKLTDRQMFWRVINPSATQYYSYMEFQANDTLHILDYSSNGTLAIVTNRLFRDTSAWYHIMGVVDTTEGTASNRVKLYVNGTQETSFASTTYTLGQNQATTGTESGKNNYVGGDAANNLRFFDGLMSHVHFIDGTAYDASSFGSTDSTTGEWKINTSPSVTYGNNGFFILKDGNSGTDQSGQSNNLTVSGTITKTEDCPSNVFATWNAIADNLDVTLSNGATTVAHGSQLERRPVISSLGASSGKYYAEFKPISGASGNVEFGIVTQPTPSAVGRYMLQSASNCGSVSYINNGHIEVSNASSTVENTYTSNDVIGVAVDMDNKRVYFYKNGTLENSGGTDFSGITVGDGNFYFCNGDRSGSSTYTAHANFGNGYFGSTQISSAGTNASGIGIFEYDVPTGYTALSTKGLNL